MSSHTRAEILHWAVFFIVMLMLFLLFLLLLHLLRKLLRRKGGLGSGSGYSYDAWDHDGHNAYAQPAITNKPTRLKALTTADPLLGQVLSSRYSPHGSSIETMDPDGVNRIAKLIPDGEILILEAALSQRDLQLDMQPTIESQPTDRPNRYMQPEAMRSYDQLPQILTEQQMLDDDEFYALLSRQDLTVLQPYETTQEIRRATILLDVSGSMSGSRSDFAKAITISLLLQAQRDEAEYHLRLFDAAPHELLVATNPAQAENLIHMLLSTRFDSGGTNILAALETVGEDEADRISNDVVLITDGQDDDVTKARLDRILRGNTRLHALLIGAPSKILASRASTYHVYDDV